MLLGCAGLIGATPGGAAEIINSDFQTDTIGNVPSGWTLNTDNRGSSTATVQDVGGSQRMRLIGQGVRQYIEPTRYFDAQSAVTGAFSAEWQFMEPIAGNFLRMALFNDTRPGAGTKNDPVIDIYTRDYPSKQLCYIDSSGDQVPFASIDDNTWYTVKVEVDWATSTYKIYVNAELKTSTATFRKSAASINRILFSSAKGRQNTYSYIDNVKVNGTGSAANPPTIDDGGGSALEPDDVIDTFTLSSGESNFSININNEVVTAPSQLRVTNLPGHTKWSYVSFDVKGVYDEVDEVTLRLTYHGADQAVLAGHKLYIYNCPNGWNTSSMTWATRPMSKPAPPDAPLAVVDVPSVAGTVIDIPIPQYVFGTGTYAFLITTNANFAIILRSAAAATGRPALLVKHKPRKRDISEIEAVQAPIQQRLGDETQGGYGILDVTKAPYFADKTGVKDSTLAIQRAVIEARLGRMQVWFPTGTYLISDTIQCIEGVIEDPLEQGNKIVQMEYPNVLRGSVGPSGQRAKIKLAPNSQGFGDSANPKPAIRFMARKNGDFVVLKDEVKVPKFLEVTNYYQTIISLDVDISGYPGAIGVDNAAAQGAYMEDMTITATDAHIGVSGIPGIGGGTYNIRVVGGRTGLFCDKYNPPAACATYWTFTGQTSAAVETNGNASLLLVGCRIEGKIIAQGLSASEPDRGSVAVVDSELIVPTGAVGITTNRHVYLSNVYVSGGSPICSLTTDSGGTTTLLGNGTGWTYVKEYAASASTSREAMNVDSVLTYGVQQYTQAEAIVNTSFVLPADHRSAHVVPTRPSWEDSGVTNVKDMGAVGNGTSADDAAIQSAIDAAESGSGKVFLPKGRYLLSNPLVLRSKTQLFGVSPQKVRLIPDTAAAAFSNPSAPRAVVETIDDPEATTQLDSVMIRTPLQNMTTRVYGVKWQVGRKSVFRNNTLKNDGYLDLGVDNVENQLPLVQIRGNGGGYWLTPYILPTMGAQSVTSNYRHLYIEGTSQRLNMYSLDVEHGQGLAQMEIANASNLNVYGFKSEGPYSRHLCMINNSRNVKIVGYYGLTSAFEGYPLFKIQNCVDYVFGSMYRRDGEGADPVLWYLVGDDYGSYATYISARHYVPLFKMGKSLPYFDSFEDGSANVGIVDGWTVANGTAGTIVDNAGSKAWKSTDATFRAHVGSGTWTDYAVEAKITVTSWVPETKVGVMGRYSDAANHYFMMYDNQAGKLRAVKRISTNGVTNNYYTDLVLPTPSSGTHTYRLEMKGKVVTAYLDTHSVSFTDNGVNWHMAGKAGVYGTGLSATNFALYDDVAITAK